MPMRFIVAIVLICTKQCLAEYDFETPWRRLNQIAVIRGIRVHKFSHMNMENIPRVLQSSDYLKVTFAHFQQADCNSFNEKKKPFSDYIIYELSVDGNITDAVEAL